MIEKSETENSSAKLSVVVVSPYSHAMLRKCLESILASVKQDKIEVLVSDCCADEVVSDLIQKYPDVNFLEFPGKSGIPALAAAGIEKACGEIVALTDSSCMVESNWVSSILTAHRMPSQIIGGAVEIRGPMKPLDWAAYFCEYGQFAYPLKSGTVDALPGNNISFKRSVLAVKSEYAKKEFWKTYWCQELQAKGVELITEPSILVYYAKEYKTFFFFIAPIRSRTLFRRNANETNSIFRKIDLRRRLFFSALCFPLPHDRFSSQQKTIFERVFPFVSIYRFSDSFLVVRRNLGLSCRRGKKL